MQKKIIKNIKLLITVAIICAFLWFLVISPMLTFKNNEKKLEEAARRYFELNSNELPTGKRVKTLTLNTLYHKAYLKGDLNIPYTKKNCSITNSWVKVRKENNEYKYYTYLECGILSSTVDHKGPEIILNGDMEVTVGKGEIFKDSGVKSVVDNVDGKLKTSDVTISGKVDTSKIGTYEIKYVAYDNLKNKTEVIRKVNVVQKLYNTIKSSLNDKNNFSGDPENNYVRLSNMLFRVYGVDSDKNVVIVSDEDIANVSYSKLDKWLDYYYDNLNKTTQKMIVKKKYCNMVLEDISLETANCSSYTKEKKIYIPSTIEVNNASLDGYNFMRPSTISWVANSKKNTKEAYVTRNIFFGSEYGKTYLSYDIDDNYGVRPMMTIKGSSLIVDGDGTRSNPYVFGDVTRAKGGSKLNTRFTGEYISLDGSIYRIIKVEKDETVKVISNFTVNDFGKSLEITNNPGESKIIYNPKKNNSVAYYVNNRLGEYVSLDYFVKHKVEVPIYKNKIIYGEETKTNTYDVVVSIPNMFEIFSAQPQNNYNRSYWMLNSSNGDRVVAGVYDIGVPINDKENDYLALGIRIVGYVKKDSVISSGDGTIDSPYIIR